MDPFPIDPFVAVLLGVGILEMILSGTWTRLDLARGTVSFNSYAYVPFVLWSQKKRVLLF